MIVRYSKDKKGKTKKLAIIYTQKEHGICKNSIDSDALFICNKLRHEGYQAYIVGGAVRDLLLEKKPKDFDIVTDAFPGAIRKLFRYSRIIGRRFRLVHVSMGQTVYEVSTFRSNNSDGNGNSIFGTMTEDVWRRDFTMNSLYYCPAEEHVIDFTGGYKDIKRKKIKAVIPLKIIFSGDPVRIIRAIKYSVITGGKFTFFLKLKIKSQVSELTNCSPSRLTEEILKIMKSGYSAPIFRTLANFGILQLIFLGMYEAQKKPSFYEKLEDFDKIKKDENSDTKIADLLIPLLEDFLYVYSALTKECETIKDIMVNVKIFLRPITPPNNDLIDAIKKIYRQNGKKIKALPIFLGFRRKQTKPL